MWNFSDPGDDRKEDNKEGHLLSSKTNYSGNYNTFGESSTSFDFNPTPKLSDTLKLPSIRKSSSEINFGARNKSLRIGKSILKSKSETQLVSILKESSSQESEVDRYLSGGYSEVIDTPKEQPKRPALKYTKSESKFGTYGFDSSRYAPGGVSHSYKPVSKDSRPTFSGLGDNGNKNKTGVRMSRSQSVGDMSLQPFHNTSYTQSLDHFTLKVVDREVRQTQSLADTLTFPKEYKYDHFTLQGDRLVPSPSKTCRTLSSGSVSTKHTPYSSRLSNVRSEPLRPGHGASKGPVLRPPQLSRATNTSRPYACRSSGPRPSAVSSTLKQAKQAETFKQTGPKQTGSKQTAVSNSSSVSTQSETSHFSLSTKNETQTSEPFDIPLSPQYTKRRPCTPVPAHVTIPVPPPVHVTAPTGSEPQNSPPSAELLAAIAHLVPLVSVQNETPKQVVVPKQVVAPKPVATPPTPPAEIIAPPARENSPSAYQNSKSRAVANLRSRQVQQARGIRVLPPSPLRYVCDLTSEKDEEESRVYTPQSRVQTHTRSRDSYTLLSVPSTGPKRPSLFRSYNPQKLGTIFESRDSVFAEMGLFRSRDLLEKLKFRKPTTLTMAKSLVDEILLSPARYLLIKQEKLRKYALLHSAVTNCYIFNTGWIADHRSRMFDKAEGPFIGKRK
ncbi:hypothetical protein CJU90_0861 [Yarrowia sp. C11]|nr:hypothetical protein CJU90_0861 [Yarrowia sp. C11]